MNKTEQLKEAIETLRENEGTEWIRIGAVQELTGWTADELAGAVRGALTNPAFQAEPEPFRYRLTEADRKYAPVIGGEACHLLSWDR